MLTAIRTISVPIELADLLMTMINEHAKHPSVRTNAQRTVLVCDDNPDIRELCATILSAAGYTVETASGYAEFQTKFDPTAPPHVLVLDVHMPEHDGFWIAENLGSGVRVPIIFVTGHDRPVYRLYAPIVGAFDYLTKPFEPEQLLERVANALKIQPKPSSALMPAVPTTVSGRHPRPGL